MIRSQLKKITLSFCTESFIGCFCSMAILFTQNNSVQIRIVISFSKVLYCGVSQFQHMKNTYVPEIETPFQKREKGETIELFPTVRLHQRKARGYRIQNKNVLFLWKYQVSLNFVFWIERDSKTLMAKIFCRCPLSLSSATTLVIACHRYQKCSTHVKCKHGIYQLLFVFSL